MESANHTARVYCVVHGREHDGQVYGVNGRGRSEPLYFQLPWLNKFPWLQGPLGPIHGLLFWSLTTLIHVSSN